METVMEKIGCPMRKKRVSLHLSETNPSSKLPSLDGLTCQIVDGSDGSHLELVTDHVTQPLVVDQPNVDVAGHLLSSYSTDHLLLAQFGKALLLQIVPEIVDWIRRLTIRSLERRGIDELTFQGSGLGNETLDEHSNGHARGEGVWVDDEVGANAGGGAVRHIDIGPKNGQHTLLPVATTELVSNHGVTVQTVFDIRALCHCGSIHR
mmetsp:Transcript_4905/g.8982  ORF Transcript_4905/g.8982 Transcript_4905/m.8982 type:complete len:207 (+) Transcript_4905:1372-1992(+)